MKKTLLISRLAVVSLMFCTLAILNGQTVIFSEDFAGFSGGSHSSPSTTDVSGSLDSKTHLPGWTGYKIYSAGGEIKLGTSDKTGWIETPIIDLSNSSGPIILNFDIASWPDDHSVVMVSLNGDTLGTNISLTDEFQTIEDTIQNGISSCKVRIESLSKRFFIDNMRIFNSSITSFENIGFQNCGTVLYPNPADRHFTIYNISGFDRIMIFDISGNCKMIFNPCGKNNFEIPSQELSSGVYYIKLISSARQLCKAVVICH